MGPRPVTVDALLSRAPAQGSIASEEEAYGPQARVRTAASGRHSRLGPAVLSRAARSVARATQLRRIGR
jgi:hypothetical protein